jgi:hypothetical protein
MKKLLLLLLLFIGSVQAQPTGCAAEAGLTGRSDIQWCEGFESSTWWQRSGYVGDVRKTSSGTLPVIAAYMENTSIVSTGCISGNCMRVECYAWDTQDGGCTGMLAIYLRIPNGPHERIYYRYYLYLAPNWSPASFCADVQQSLCSPLGGSHSGGGKWPGISDGRGQEDGGLGQCGNGGWTGNEGEWCWSARLKYMECDGKCDGPGVSANSAAHTRIGFYWYLPDAANAAVGSGDGDETTQAFGPWDHKDGDGTDGNCSASSDNLGAPTNNTNDSLSCGKGFAGLERGKWYRVEGYHQMNTAGVANGVARAWITDVATNTFALRYEKTNVLYRRVGHDNLHNRLFFFNFHHGGESLGPAQDTYLLMDQLVISTEGRAGSFKSSGASVSQPFNVQIQ